MNTKPGRIVMLSASIGLAALFLVVGLAAASVAGNFYRVTTGATDEFDNGYGLLGTQGVSYSPDGDTIAFTSDDMGASVADDAVEIWLYDVPGMQFTRVTTASDIHRDSIEPDLSSDGGHLVFQSDSSSMPGYSDPTIADDQYEVWLYDIQAAAYTRVTTSPGRLSGWPTVSTNGQWVAFASSYDHENNVAFPVLADLEIWLYETATADYTRLTTGLDFNNYPDISDDGSLVAYFKNVSPPELRLIEYDGATITDTLITDTIRNVGMPLSISGDGSKIAFLDTADDIWLYDVAGGTFTRVAGGSPVCYHPNLNSDGSRLAFSQDSATTGAAQIWVYDVPNKRKLLVSNHDVAWKAAYLPQLNGDGTELAFAFDGWCNKQDDCDNKFEIYNFEGLPHLTLTKSDIPDPVGPGHTLTYTLEVDNDSLVDISNITLTDTYDSSTSVQDADGGSDNGTRVLWPSFSLSAAEITTRTLVMEVDNSVTTGTLLWNEAVVTTTVDAGDIETISTTVHIPALSLGKVANPDPVIVSGGQALLTYTISLTNEATIPATGVRLTDTLDLDSLNPLTFAWASDGGSETAPGSRVVTWPAAPAPAQDTIKRTVVLTVGNVVSGTVLNNAVEATFAEASDVVETSLDTPVQNPDRNYPVLVPNKIDTPDPVEVGDLLTYTLTVRNIGPIDATGAIITDTFDDGHLGVKSSDGGTLVGTDQVQWMATVPANQTVTRTLVMTVYSAPAGGVLANEVQVSSPSGEVLNSPLTVNTTVNGSNGLSISKVGPDNVFPNTPVVYTLIVANTGPSPVSGLVFTDTLPTGAHYVSGGTLVGGNVVSFTVPYLAGNSSVTRTFTVTTTELSLTNSDYRAAANGGLEANGATSVTTTIRAWLHLPLIFKN